MLWEGTAHHLWFLPFAIGVSLVAFVVGRWMVRGSQRTRWVLAGLAAIGVWMACFDAPHWATGSGRGEYFLRLTWRAMPSVLWGLAFAAAWGLRNQRLAFGRRTQVLALMVMSLAMLASVMVGRHPLPENAAGAACFVAAMGPCSGRWWGVVGQAGRWSYAVYLAHVLFIEGVQAAAHRAGIGSSWALDVGVFLLATGLSVALAVALVRFRPTRWMAGEA